jgi:LPXTG-motif cell wall-anchored protein
VVTTTGGTVTVVTPAGPITWAPGFGPNGAVGGVQTTPTTTGGTTTRTGTGQQGVLGVQTLPSTSTDSNGPLAGLGGILMAIGAYLLRKPSRRIS